MKTTEQVHSYILYTHSHPKQEHRRAETRTSQGMSALLVQGGVAVPSRKNTSMERLTRHFMATKMAQLNLSCAYGTT